MTNKNIAIYKPLKISELIALLKEKTEEEIVALSQQIEILKVWKGMKKDEIIKELEDDLKNYGDFIICTVRANFWKNFREKRDKVLVCLANFEIATEFCEVFYKRLLPEIHIDDILTITLDGDFYRSKFIEMLEEKKPKLLELNGHGRLDLLTGTDYDKILWYGDEEGYNTLKKAGVEGISCLSCEVGLLLGKDLVKKGIIKWFRGYDDKYFFAVASQTPNPNDPFAYPFFYSHLYFWKVYKATGDVEKSFEASTHMYIEFTKHNYPNTVKRLLKWDADHHVLHMKEEQPPPPPPRREVYLCPICRKQFENKKEYLHHLVIRRLWKTKICIVKDPYLN